MAFDIKGILGAGMTLQAGALAYDNSKLLNKKITTKRLIKQGVTNVVGISLLQSQANLIGGL